MEEGRFIKVTGLNLEVSSDIHDGPAKKIKIAYSEDGIPLWDCNNLLYAMMTGAEKEAIYKLASKLRKINLHDLISYIQSTEDAPEE